MESLPPKTGYKVLKNNLARKPQGNDRGQVKAIFQGQCDVALGNTYYMGKMLEREDQRAWAASVGIFFPNQKNRGTHMNISGGAITKAAKKQSRSSKAAGVSFRRFSTIYVRPG
jgi:iron(III) transport system substrate-binding protein